MSSTYVIYLASNISRHTVVCQQQRKPCGTQVCSANLLFSTPCISITIGLISMKFTCFMPSMCTTLHSSVLRYVFLKTAQFSPHFSSLQHFKKSTKDTCLVDQFLSNLVYQ